MTEQIISHYRVLRELGRGGMGVVFEAEDLSLGRKVALKFLPDDIGDDVPSLERFRREARILSSLNHPNICTVYEIGEFHERHYIAMELIEGEPLKRVIAAAVERQRAASVTQTMTRREDHGPIEIERIFEWAAQLGDALDAAHAKGVIHRDIKPDNIFITARGQAKILDFGLAKTIHEAALPDFGQLTVPGAAIGTLSYMSPEQALGKEIDARTDLFSLGVVLYETATGRLPFTGPTSAAVFEAILHQQPSQPSSINTGVPAPLEEIIAKCLEKDPNLRYQSAAEFCADLKRGRRDRFGHSGESRAAGTAFRSAPVVKPKRPILVWAGMAGAAILVLAGLALSWKLWQNMSARPMEPVLQRLTSDSGLSASPAISSDGKMLAYASDRSGEGNLDIWVRQVAGGDPIRLTKDPADDTEPNFSPDGTMLAFHSDREGGGLYVVPVLGGQDRRIADGGRRPRFSPDGKHIAYWTGEPPREVPVLPNSGAIYIADTGGGTPRRLRPDFAIATRPLWTSDGSRILFWGSPQGGDAANGGWWITPVEGGKAVAVTSTAPEFTPKIFEGSEPYGWRKDNIVFSTRQPDNSINIYEAPFSVRDAQVTGAPHRLTFGTTQEESPSVAADGSLVFASVAGNLDVYTLPMDVNRGKAAVLPQRITTDLADDTSPSLSADGRMLAFFSLRSGKQEVWIKRLPDGKETMLAPGRNPRISPDGTLVAFTQLDLNRSMIIPAGGGASRQVSSPAVATQSWSADNSLLMVAPYDKPKATVEIVDVASGKISEYLSHPRSGLYGVAFSPDGRWISLSKISPEGKMLMVAPFRTSAPPPESEWIAVTDAQSNNFQPRWSPDEKVLYFISDRDGFACLWARRMDAATQRPQGDPFPVLHLHRASLRMRTDETFLSVAKDKLAFSLEERSGSIWMLKFK